MKLKIIFLLWLIPSLCMAFDWSEWESVDPVQFQGKAFWYGTYAAWNGTIYVKDQIMLQIVVQDVELSREWVGYDSLGIFAYRASYTAQIEIGDTVLVKAKDTVKFYSHTVYTPNKSDEFLYRKKRNILR